MKFRKSDNTGKCENNGEWRNNEKYCSSKRGRNNRKKLRFVSFNKFSREEVGNSFKTVKSRNGAYSAAAIAIVVVIAVVLNLAVAKLPATVKQVDISNNRIYEISDATKNMLNELENDITITVVAETDSVDERLTTFLEKYAALSRHISLKTVDPVLHPSALTEYGTEADTVIVSCEKTGISRQIAISDILVQDMYSYYYSGTSSISSFDGDGQISAAVNQVCGAEERKAYYLTDHGEAELPDSIISLMTKSGISAEGLSLLMKNEIPDDCDVLIANGISSDMTEDEIKLLNEYIQSGGNVVLLLSEKCPESGNLKNFMKDYGITMKKGYVADMERCYQQNYYYIFPNISSSDELTGNLNTGMVLMANSRGFSVDEGSEEISAASILDTSSYGYLVTDDSETQGTFSVAAQATYTATVKAEDKDSDSEKADTDDGDEKDSVTDDDSGSAADADDAEESASKVVTGTLTVYGSDTLIDESLTSAFSGLDNNTLFMNTVTSPLDDMSNLSIEAKSLEVQYNTPQHGGLISVMIIFVIPVGVVIAGFVIWMRRRKA